MSGDRPSPSAPDLPPPAPSAPDISSILLRLNLSSDQSGASIYPSLPLTDPCGPGDDLPADYVFQATVLPPDVVVQGTPLAGTGSGSVAPLQNTDLVEHLLKPYDTLQGLAVQYGVTVCDIKQVNNLISDSFGHLEKLFVPSSRRLVQQTRAPPSEEGRKRKLTNVLMASLKLTFEEARYYLENNEYDVVAAHAECVADLEWERSQTSAQKGGKYQRLVSMDRTKASSSNFQIYEPPSLLNPATQANFQIYAPPSSSSSSSFSSSSSLPATASSSSSSTAPTASTTSTSSSDKPGVIRHPITSADTLQGLALRYRVTMQAIKQVNNMLSDNIAHMPYILVPTSFTTAPISQPPDEQEMDEQRRKKLVLALMTSLQLPYEDARHYLESNNFDVAAADREARGDLEWERSQQTKQKRMVIN